MRRFPLVALGTALATAFVVARLTIPAAQEASLTIQPMQSPAAAGSAQPQLTVSERGVLLSWIERTGTYAAFKFAERTATGWTDTAAGGRRDRTGSSTGQMSHRSFAWRTAPSTDIGCRRAGRGTYAYDVRLARSTDDGNTFSASFTPHHDGTQTEHGFASLVSDAGRRPRARVARWPRDEERKA